MRERLQSLTGQSRAKEQIRVWLEGDRLPHAILVTGSEGVGKRQLALELAKAINCQSAGSEACGRCASCSKTDSLNHPNVHMLVPLPTGGGKRSEAQTLSALRDAAVDYLQQDTTLTRSGHNIPRDHIRLLQREMGYAPTEAPKRIGLIFEAESMHKVGANSLLKTLEEPQQHAVFILVSSHPDRLLPTIVSRCQRLPLAPLSTQELKTLLAPSGLDDERLELAARSAAGSRGRAIGTLDEEFRTTRELALGFVEAGLGEGKEEEYWAVQQEVTGAGDKGRFEKFLHIVAVLLRDLFLLHHGRQEHIVNVDQAVRLRRCLERVQPERIECVATELEHAQECLVRNVNPQLLLARVWWQLLQSRTTTV